MRLAFVSAASARLSNDEKTSSTTDMKRQKTEAEEDLILFRLFLIVCTIILQNPTIIVFEI